MTRECPFCHSTKLEVVQKWEVITYSPVLENGHFFSSAGDLVSLDEDAASLEVAWVQCASCMTDLSEYFEINTKGEVDAKA